MMNGGVGKCLAAAWTSDGNDEMIKHEAPVCTSE
jgi:hypothetical protein